MFVQLEQYFLKVATLLSRDIDDDDDDDDNNNSSNNNNNNNNNNNKPGRF
jgi:hypothetical protein